MIPIEKEPKRIDWNAIKAEYIGGGTSYRKLSAKHRVSLTVLKRRARDEEWPKLREEAEHKAATLITQKTAAKMADNATIAADLKKSLLMRLKRIEEHYPMDATEVRTRAGNNTAIYRIRDLTAAYKDLTEDLQTGTSATNELLQSLVDLEKRAGL